jgi:hypothetical protein
MSILDSANICCKIALLVLALKFKYRPSTHNYKRQDRGRSHLRLIEELEIVPTVHQDQCWSNIFPDPPKTEMPVWFFASSSFPAREALLNQLEALLLSSWSSSPSFIQISKVCYKYMEFMMSSE